MASDPGTPGRGDVGPLVSVIVPAFNAEATLGDTLRSVANQSYPHVEVVIVDDGSTDRTAEIAAGFCKSHPRARLLTQANAGVGAARNLGIGASRGEYVAPVDADDLWHPEKIARQVAVARAAPEPPGFVYCWSRLITEEGRVWGTGPAYVVRGRCLHRLLYRNFVGNGSALLIRRAAAIGVGGYDETLADGCEDLLLQLQVGARYRIDVVPEYLVGYRTRAGSMSRDAEQMARAWRTAFEALSRTRGPLPSRPVRWTRAARALALAENRAMRRNLRGAARSVAESLWLDPLGTGAHLAYRGTRFLRHRVLGRGERHRMPLFLQAPPEIALACDPDEIAGLRLALREFDSARMRVLAAADEPHTGSR